MVVAFPIMSLALYRDANWMTAGLSALFAWLPLLLVDQRHLRSGVLALVIYLIAGCGLSLLGHLLLEFETGRIIAVGGVAFLAAMMLRFGVFWYLVGYVLLFWYVVSPVFSGSLGLAETLEGHIVGALGISMFWVIRRVWVDGWTWGTAWPKAEVTPRRVALGYAGVLAGTTMTGIGIGGRLLSIDPTLMAQASLNIIAPSVKQTWEAGLVRVVFGFVGLLAGFYLGFYFPDILVYQVVIAVSSFFALALFKVHMAFLVGAFAVIFGYPIGQQGGDIAHNIGNERLLAEFLGILLACLAILILSWIQRNEST